MKRATDSGQMAVMIVGFFVVIGLLGVVVINASAAFLQRQQLNNIADGAAITAAQTVEEETIYRSGLDALEDVPLDRHRARRAVGRYLSGVPDLRWELAGDDDRVVVTVFRRLKLPLVPPGWTAETVVRADASALLRLH